MSTFESSKDFLEWAITLVAKLERARLGLSIDEDKYAGLINIKDPRERTRLNKILIQKHTYLELVNRAAKEKAERLGGINSYEIFGQAAEMGNAYFISEDGKQRLEMIWMNQAKRPEAPSLIIPAMPQPGQEQKKSRFGFLKRGKTEE